MKVVPQINTVSNAAIWPFVAECATYSLLSSSLAGAKKTGTPILFQACPFTRFRALLHLYAVRHKAARHVRNDLVVFIFLFCRIYDGKGRIGLILFV